MNKIALFLGLWLTLFTNPSLVNAQKAGLGLAYGNKLNMVGGQIDATYRFHRFFRIAGNASVFRPRDFKNSNERWSWWAINVNGHLVFLDTGRFRSYLLTGLNYATIRIKNPQTGRASIDSDIGLNAGGGLEYSLSFGDLFGESKYVFIGPRYQQTTVQAGVRFYLRSK